MIKALQLKFKHDQELYKIVLEDLRCTEPHFSLSYLKYFGGGLEQLYCLVFESNTNKFMALSQISPIIINGENKGYFDAVSPYGYFGPIHKYTPSEADIHMFWNFLMEWYTANNIVTEFVRFSLNGNESGYPGHLVSTMLNIKGEIKEADEQWSNFDRKVRKNVNRALRENLTFHVYTGSLSEKIIDEFYSIYIATMERNSAMETFFYAKKNFTELFNAGDTVFALAMVYSDCVAVSTELVLCSDECLYSFLGGTEEKFFEKRPNDFLKFELINWARLNGFKYFVLGGGYGKEDGIYKYKRCFFPSNTVTYYTGRSIFLKDKYIEICKMVNITELDFLEESVFFPQYNIKSIK